MAITNRNGLKEQFIPSKLLPGELAIAIDTGNAWYCYGGGKVMLMATATDIETLQQKAGNYQEAHQIIIDRSRQHWIKIRLTLWLMKKPSCKIRVI